MAKLFHELLKVGAFIVSSYLCELLKDFQIEDVDSIKPNWKIKK